MPITTFDLLKHLYDGCIIRTRHNRNPHYEHAVFKNYTPVALVSKAQFKELSPLLKEKKGDFTLNLNEVRKLSGHTLPKKLYKVQRMRKQKEKAI